MLYDLTSIDQHVCGRRGREQSDDEAWILARSSARLSATGPGADCQSGRIPCSYEVFNGNRADVTTMEVILRTIERKYGKARRVWVMDRGIVSEANLAAIRKRDGQYLKEQAIRNRFATRMERALESLKSRSMPAG